MDAGAWIGEAADAFWSSVGDVLKSQVLEGSVAGGGKGIVQTVITDSEAFEFSPGHAYP
jgi:hypothetical protein